VSIRIPDCGPLGDTFFEARALAIVAASFVNNPACGCVASVFTVLTHLLVGFRGMSDISGMNSHRVANIQHHL